MKTANLAILLTRVVPDTARDRPRTFSEERRLRDAHAWRVVPVCRAHGGRVHAARGGAFRVVFSSPTAAVLCALEVEAERARGGPAASRRVRFALRQVVSTGEVWLEPDDIAGEPAELAERLQDALGGDGVYLTESTWLVMDKARVPSDEVGSFPSLGRVFRARARQEGNRGPGWSGEVRRRVAQASLLWRRWVRRVREVTWRQARWGAAVLCLVAVPVVVARWPSRVEGALEALARAPEAEREARAREVRAMLATEEDAGVRAFHEGRLHELLGEPRQAVEDYLASAQAGGEAAAARLMELLAHAECPVRAAAARGLGTLSLEAARGPLLELAERGPGDGVNDRCGSRRAAAQVLRKLEAPRPE